MRPRELTVKLLFAASWLASILAAAWEVTNRDTYTHAVDFTSYRGYTNLVFAHGWSAYYSPDPSLPLNINPPYLAILLWPFLALSPSAGLVLWSALGVAALAGAWWLSGDRQLLHLLAVLLFFPVIYTLLLGQVVLLLAALIVLAWWLAEHRHPFAAGALLTLCSLKPQLIFLLPLVLLLAGHWRVVVGFAVAGLGLFLISVATVGTSGLQQMLVNQHYVLLHPHDNYLIPSMILTLWLPGPLGLALSALLAFGALLLAWRLRRAPLSIVFSVGLLASLLLAPYLHPQDLTLWAIVALLLARSFPLPRTLLALGLFAAWSWIPFSGILFPPLAPAIGWLPLVPLTSLAGLVCIAYSLRQSPSPAAVPT